jgi:polygalacturonase
MKAEIIFKSTRNAVLEITGFGKYKTISEYEIYINDSFRMKSNKAVQTIAGLTPDTVYTLEIRTIKGEQKCITFRTEYEFVTLDVKKFGAKGDGTSDDTMFIQAAINSCPKNGRVLIPAGTYRVSSLFLKDNLHLEIAKNAIVLAFTEKEKFPILPGIIESYDETEDYNLGSWEGNPLPMYASILTGINVSDIVITGEGILDGGAGFDNWWSYKREKPMPFRPRMLFLNGCSNVTLHGITVKNSPSWTLHPYFSEDLKFIDLKIQNPADSPNTDGMDPESCKNVDIIGIHFTVGDDCIAVKSGKIYMGSKLKTPCENITIRNCLMESGHGAVTIGSEMAGGVKKLLVKDCVFLDTDRGLRIKTRRGRGKDAILDEIIFEDIEMDEVKAPFVINSFYFCDPDGHTEYVRTKKSLPVDERIPDIRSLAFRNIEARNCHFAAFFLYGLPEKKIGSVKLSNINVTYSPNAKSGYPAMMEELEPVSKMGLYANNIAELKIQNVTISGSDYEPFLIENVEHLIKE